MVKTNHQPGLTLTYPNKHTVAWMLGVLGYTEPTAANVNGDLVLGYVITRILKFILILIF